MKKLFLLAMVCSALVACNNGGKTSTENSDNKSEKTETAEAKDGFVMLDGKTFDLKGNVKEMKFSVNQDFIADYTLSFDNEGKLVNCSSSDNINAERKDNKLVSYQNGIYTYTFDYNEKGFPKSIEESVEEDQSSILYELTYNENNELISQFYNDGYEDGAITHNYAIVATDANGNWTKRNYNMEDSTLCWIETREIVYY